MNKRTYLKPTFQYYLIRIYCSCDYLQSCKATGNSTLLGTSSFCLKFGNSRKCLKVTFVERNVIIKLTSINQEDHD